VSFVSFISITMVLMIDPNFRLQAHTSLETRPRFRLNHIGRDSWLTSAARQDILMISISSILTMPTKAATANQIAFRYRGADSPTGVTRQTAKRIADKLGVDETQAIHLALHELAVKVLPQYAPDDGPLSAAQLRQIRKSVPKGKRSVRSSLFSTKTT
jgi:hypothetical protein